MKQKKIIWKNLHKVCDKLQECGLKLDVEKCEFMQEKLEVSGFVTNNEGFVVISKYCNT